MKEETRKATESTATGEATDSPSSQRRPWVKPVLVEEDYSRTEAFLNPAGIADLGLYS